MTKYQVIFDALKNARLYSAQTGNAALSSAILQAETMAEIEIGLVDWLNADTPQDAIINAVFSDCVRSRGAPMTNLSHNASFHSKEKIALSNHGIKHLRPLKRVDGDDGQL